MIVIKEKLTSWKRKSKSSAPPSPNLTATASAQLEKCSDGGRRPIHDACLSGDMIKARYLVENGIDVNVLASDGRTALHLATITQNVAIATLLLRVQNVLVDVKDLYGKTALHYAVMNNAMPCLSVLLASGADANTPYRPGGVQKGDTPLHIAVRKGYMSPARILVNYGADINAQGSHDATPLHLALGYGHQPLADFLLSKGADTKKEDDMGHIPLQTAIARASAVDIGHYAESVHFDPNYANSRGETCLHTAAGFDRTSVAEILVRLGSDINARDASGRTPLHWAVGQTRVAFVEFLGRQPGLSLEHKDSAGDSPLQLVVHEQNNPSKALEFGVGFESEDCRIGRLLIDWGADVNTLNARGETPLHKAVMARKAFLVDLLVKSGADLSICDAGGRSILRCLIETPRYSKYGHVRQSRILVDASAQQFVHSGRLYDHSKDICKMFSLLFTNGARL